MAARQLQEYTKEQVAQHNKEGDLWIIIDAKVYDLTRFANLHPGGKSVLLENDVRGTDATEIFYSLHKSEVLQRPQYKRLQIGTVKGEKELFKPLPPGSLSPVPYGEPQWLTKGFKSPYYNESHYRLQREFRKFCDEVLIPEAKRCETTGAKISQEVVEVMGKSGINAMRFGPGPHLKGQKLMTGLTPETFDRFHELLLNQEVSRSGQRAFIDGCLGGAFIGLPPVIHFSRPEIRDKVVPEIVSGKKYISLAISEAFAGSDVAGLRCTAKLTPDKKFWIVNGTKKWITNGHFSDYFSTACRTSKRGLTMLLIERGPGVETKPIKTSYSSTAGTAYITFDNVKVPVENTLGEVDQGLKVVLSNFNHERWGMTANSVQMQRNIVDETLRWTNQRIVFGKPLIEQPVVRAKIAQMISRVEACQTWLEHITLQMQHMNYAQQSKYLAGPIGLLKQYSTAAGQETARDATQLFGGRAITQSGLGSSIELYHRTIAFDAILGGAEDVLADLGVRQAQKQIPKNVRL
ncbi:acyl-CoA dehydrogenase/oxidase [Cantharellus anzutake]|uniref:acyl-CoA dehydrogenase/oxidase n=1 Tax=Cantharellus anzutake TaxID=1750568 RepID=UPI0019061B09|nr:acyl-CoA dehydrogenase/oxidase [Cantharellus anzutake]KAF8342018.1 acyl-CoA dehydrogenase/oxidase [Cantharellus anzutake]